MNTAAAKQDSPSHGSPLLRVSGLGKRYGRVVTANHVTFDVNPGGALGIVGPNGAGKSTLLSLIAGTVRPDEGRIEFDGSDITTVSAAKRSVLGIGRSYQIPRPFTDMTVFENVLVGATFGGGKSGRDAQVTAHSALEATGLADRANAASGSLRLLDRKRLELARAMATGPRLILLDEIAGGLTEHELPELVQTVKGLRDTGVAVVWIEHIVHALLQVVDELLCLAAGQVIAIGEPTAVMADEKVAEVYLGTTVDLGEAS